MSTIAKLLSLTVLLVASCAKPSDESVDLSTLHNVPSILTGSWSGTSSISLTATAPISFNAALSISENLTTRTSTVTGVCKGGGGSVAMHGTVGGAYWTGSLVCPPTGLGFTTCPETTVTYTSGSVISMPDGSLVAQFNGSALATGPNCEVSFVLTTLLFTGVP